MELDTVRTDILVVGAGPTGLTVANILGQGGIATLLIDQKDSTVGEPRAVSIDDESLRTMQAIGLVQPVLENVVTGYGVHYITKPAGRCFAKVEPTASNFGYPRRNAFRQPLFEATLREGLCRFDSVDTRFGHKLESFTQDETGVSAIVLRKDGTQMRILAKYMVGCDGGRSPIREMLEIPMTGSTFKSRWLVVDTENDDDDFSQTRVYCDARRPVVDVPGPHRTRRFEVLIHPHENAEEATSESRVEELLRPFRQGRPTSIVRKVVYTFHARMAEKWRSERVFLAGDAAHLTPPYAGQGLNSGIRDAHNLGWKLVARIEGLLSDAALDSYETERRPHAWALIRLALNLGEVMAPRSKLHASLVQAFFTLTGYIPPIRDYFLQMKFKPKPYYANGLLGPTQVGTEVRGRMFPQPRVRTLDGREVLLDDLIGSSYALVSYHSGGDVVVLDAPLWRNLDVTRVCVFTKHDDIGILPPGAIVAIDSSGGLRQFFAGQDGNTVLVRPDRYVAGVFATHEEEYFSIQFGACLGLELK